MFSSPLRLFPLFPNNVFSLPLNEFILFLPAKFQIEAKPRIIEIEETFAENSINQEDIAPVHGKRRIGKCGQVRRASLRVTDEITLGWAL